MPTLRSSATAGRDELCFGTEAEMMWPLASGASRFLGKRAAADSSELFFEVPSASGVPDMLIVEFDRAAVRERSELGLGQASGVTEARILWRLQGGPSDAQQLAASAGVSSAHLRSGVLPEMVESGLIAWNGVAWSAVPSLGPLVSSVVAVEAKRRDWRGALKQARRYSRFANLSFIALDERSAAVPLAHARDIAAMGIGVATVAADEGVVRVHRRPRWRSPRVGWEFFLIGERLYELAKTGSRSGPRFDVFGRTPDPTPDVMPGLRFGPVAV